MPIQFMQTLHNSYRQIGLRRVRTIFTHLTHSYQLTHAAPPTSQRKTIVPSIMSASPTAVLNQYHTNPLTYLPPPPTRFPLHATYEHPAPEATSRVLIVGDIHGCFDEFLQLVQENDIQPGRDMVIAAGDLVAKGPKSEEVVQYFMKHNYRAIVGNHEIFMLRCALLAGRLDGKKLESNADIGHWNPTEIEKTDLDSELYAHTFYARMNGFDSVARRSAEHYAIAESLSDEEIAWIATLPLSIDLTPKLPWLVIHAGLVPGLQLQQQHPHHVTTMRNLVERDGVSHFPSDSLKVGSSWACYLSESEQIEADRLFKSNSSSSGTSSDDGSSPTATAAASTSLPTVVFGHDATRGFQRPNPLRLGLDTGCCNGKYLTGVLINVLGGTARIVSVKAREVYNVPKGKVDAAVRPPQPSGIRLSEVPCVEPAFAFTGPPHSPKHEAVSAVPKILTH